MVVSKKEQKKILSAYNEIEEVLYTGCKGNKRLKRALNILDGMIDEDVFQK